jgi:lysyl-tRNA synthetase class 2
MVKSITGGYKVMYHSEGADKEPWEVDFTPPWRRIDMIPDLEKCLGTKLPPATEFHTEGE